MAESVFSFGSVTESAFSKVLGGGACDKTCGRVCF